MKSLCRVVMLALCAGAVFVPNAASAAPILQVNASGILTGATGVDVDGTFYDVAFVDGTCVAIFSGCNSISDFDFTSDASAAAASQALLDQVFVGGFDTTPHLTNGCTGTGTEACFAFTPFLVAAGFVTGGHARNFSSTDNITTFGIDSTLDTATLAHAVWADWTPSVVTPVPEPTSLLLLGSGIAAVATKVRKRRKQQAQ